ncbi:MAG: leucine-rich repeat domain-containing protein, partial [Aureliella sp.]
FANLERLDLSENDADDSTLEAISGLAKLQELELVTTRVTDEGLKYLVKLPLKNLALDDVYDITDAGMEYVGKIKTLEVLSLSKTGVTDEGLAQLSGLENLRQLSLDNTVVSKKGVNELKSKLPKLEKVTF